MREKISSKLWGLFLLVIGILIIGNIFKFWNITLFFDGWWTLLIIIPCIITIIKNGFRTSTTIILTIGILFLLMAQDVIDSSTTNKLIIPIIFIIIGLGIIFKSMFRSDIEKIINNNSDYEIHSGKNGNYYSSVFRSRKICIPQDEFYGATLHSVFGELFVDLSACTIKQDIVIHCSTTFGDIKIKVPPNVIVKVSGSSILSSTKSQCKNKQDLGFPKIYIVRHSFFGEITIN